MFFFPQPTNQLCVCLYICVISVYRVYVLILSVLDDEWWQKSTFTERF